MNHLYKISILLLTVLLFYSCKESPKVAKPTISVEDSLGIHYTDSVYEINNEFTKIKNSLCEKIEFADLKFTNANTAIYSLDDNDSSRKFLFVSEVECGYPSGNCGSSIDMIERKGQKYVSLLKVCGKMDTIAADRSYFEYITFTNRKFRVPLNTTKPLATLISVHNMPYSDLQFISKNTDVPEDNLLLKGEKSENMDAVPVDFKQEQMGEDMKFNIYNIDNFGTHYGYVFLHNTGKNIATQQIGGKGTMKINGDKQDLIVEISDGGLVKKWKFNLSKKVFVPYY